MYTEQTENETKRLQKELSNKRAALLTIQDQPEDHTWERLWPVIYGVIINGYILFVYGINVKLLICGLIGSVVFGLIAHKRLATMQRSYEANKILEQSQPINNEILVLETLLLEQKLK